MADRDYDFETTTNVPTEDISKEDKGGKTKSTGMITQELAMSRMSLVLNGEDADLVSTLSNPVHNPRGSPRKLLGMIESIHILSHTIVTILATMKSKSTTMESRIEDIENSIKKSFEEILSSVFQRMNNSQP